MIFTVTLATSKVYGFDGPQLVCVHSTNYAGILDDGGPSTNDNALNELKPNTCHCAKP